MSEIGEKVADHYNNLAEKGLQDRMKSRIFFLRNFNNWIKSMLIGDILQKVKASSSSSIKVLDIGCGKGGDLLKWRKGGITYLVCADIASTSIEQCEQRFNDMCRRQRYERHYNPNFDAEFLTADCTKVRLQPLYKKKELKFDVVSCQFAFHYCFESFAQIDRMLQNASECLKPGGYFIGTTPNSHEIIKRLKEAEGLSFGNDVYQISFEQKEKIGLFGAKYNFHLEEVVDCPEFLVYFPALVEIAKKHGLELAFKTRFDDYFWECLKHPEGRRQHEARQLLSRMQALESYPSFDDDGQSSKNEKDYAHVKEELTKLQDADGDSRRLRMGTLSLSEWEVITLYVVFAFRKGSPDSNSKGKESDTRIGEDGDHAVPGAKRKRGSSISEEETPTVKKRMTENPESTKDSDDNKPESVKDSDDNKPESVKDSHDDKQESVEDSHDNKPESAKDSPDDNGDET